jgi:hypothetical protein
MGGGGCVAGGCNNDDDDDDDVFFLLGDSLASVFYEDESECSETSAHKIQTPGSHPKKI